MDDFDLLLNDLLYLLDDFDLLNAAVDFAL